MTTAAGNATHQKFDNTRLTIGSLRELRTVGVLCALAAFYSAALTLAAGVLGEYAMIVEPQGGDASPVFDSLATVLVMIALFVGTSVIANGVATVMAGRADQLSLLRLLGATSRQLRRSVVRAVLTVSAIGSVTGTVLGLVAVAATTSLLENAGTIPRGDYPMFDVKMLLGTVAVMITALIAALSASRAVLNSSPAAAAVGIKSRTTDGRVSRRRVVVSAAMILIGVMFLFWGSVAGEDMNGTGVHWAVLGVILSFSGIMVGAQLVIPAMVSGFARCLGSGPAAAIARQNAILDRGRTTRSTVGILIGVTLIVTVAAGMSALRTSVMRTASSAQDAAAAATVVNAISAVVIGIIAISAIVSAVGFVSTMSLTIIGRTREIGLLRTLGFTQREIRSMVTRESIALLGAACLSGTILGLVYGTVGVQSIIGSFTDGIVVGLPWTSLLLILVATTVVVLLATVVPSRRAVAVSPVTAMAMS